MFNKDHYKPTTYRDLLLDYAMNTYLKFQKGDIEEFKAIETHFNLCCYLSKYHQDISKDENYETILDDLLTYADENIERLKT